MIRRFFQSLGDMLRTPWFLGLLLAVVLALTLWFLGPLVAVSGVIVFESVPSRLVGTLAIVFLWGLTVAVLSSRRRKQEASDPAIAAQREQDTTVLERLREERRHISQIIAKAVKTVTTSNFYGPTSRSRYTLPCYLVLGAPDCGKTSMLLNSGLQFPLNEQADRYLHTLKSTEKVEVLFGNQAVFIDTPGAFTEDVSGPVNRGLWKKLLQSLFRVRPAKALNGVVVCVSMRDLIDPDTSRHEHLARVIRERLSEVLKGLRAYVPVYLVFTKCDALPGFAEFFANLSRSEREQIFGCPARSSTMDTEALHRELSALLQTLNSQIITKIHQERDSLARAGIFRFPQQMAVMTPVIRAFVSRAFGPSRYHRPVMFRGFFFSSALSAPDSMAGTAREGELSYQHGFQASRGDYAKGLFLLRLFEDFIISEAGMADDDKEQIWLLRCRRFGTQMAAAMVLIASVSVLGLSFNDNFSRMDLLEDAVGKFKHEQRLHPAGGGPAEVLPELTQLEAAMGVYRGDEDPFLSRRLGLYQGEAFGKSTRQAYTGTLTTRLLPRVRQMAADAVRRSLNDLGALKPALRAYLMLCQPEKVQKSFLEGWLEERWSELYPGRADDQHALMRHMSLLIAEGFPPAPADERVLSTARAALLKTPLPHLAYQQMKEEAAESEQSPFSFRAALGGHMSIFSGDTYSIPYLYTVAGFQDFVVERCPDIVEGLTEERWIFGPNPPLLSNLDMEKIIRAVRGMYFRDYARHWSQAVHSLRVARPRSMAGAADVAEQLCSGVSPAVLVLRELRKNTTFAVEVEQQSALEGAVEDQVARKGRQKLASMTGTKVAEAMTKGALDATALARVRAAREAVRDAQLVRLAFKPLDNLLDADGSPAPALKATQDSLARARDFFRRIAGSESLEAKALETLTGMAQDSDATLRHVEDAAKYREVSDGGFDELLEVVASAVDAAYKGSVLCVYESNLKTQYPFDTHSERDSDLVEFADFFKENGVLDEFHNAYVRPFVDAKGDLRPIMGRTLPISEAALKHLNLANKVKDAFFISGEKLGIALVIEPYALDVRLKQVDLAHGDRILSYWHGPVLPSNFVWPLDTGLPPEASLSITDVHGFKSSRTMRGDWALLRLLRQGRIKRQDGNTCLVEMEESGRWAQFLVHLRSRTNPLDPASCGFSLPESLR
jgi:type VI secretion system protein ImpL